MGKLDEETVKQAKNKLLEALANKPTTYEIDVLDNSMLPKDMKERKVIELKIKSPSLEVMNLAALETNKIPESVLEMKQHSMKESLPYLDNVVKILCIMASHGEAFPDWQVEFLKKNISPVELFQMLQECHIKMKSDFFLSSFHIANTNPMMMHKPKKRKKKQKN